jgi:hypothetical protein
MNNETKRASNVVSLHQTIWLFSKAVISVTGQGTARTPGWRALLGPLMAGLKALCARNGSDKSPRPGRDLQQMGLPTALTTNRFKMN